MKLNQKSLSLSHIITSFLISAAIVMLSQNNVNAADKPKLNIYTYDAFAADWGPAPLVKENFEKICNCEVNFIAADSSIGALRKIQLEGNTTKADIVLGLDTNIMEAARETGLFAPHQASTDRLALPIQWSDSIFLPFDYSYFSFVYDSKIVHNPPRSFKELLTKGEDFKIVIQDPRSSTPGLGLLLWVREVYGDKAADYWKKLSPQILTITKGWSDAYGLFLKGEADMVLSYTTSPAYHLIAEGNDQYRAAAFKEGHYAQVEVAAIVKSSKNKDLARHFMDFMLSDTFQDIIPTTNWTYPATQTQKGLPEGFQTLHVPANMLLLDGRVVEDNRKAYIQEWLQALGK